MDNERTHLDLFSGIGGFALAARANGVRTVQFVEIDPRCRAFLARAWPGVPVWDDVRTFSVADTGRVCGERWSAGKESGTESGRREQAKYSSVGTALVWLVTGGVPCQPASRAGKQRGKEDHRWLWPEAIRVVAEVHPTWALLENPPGIGDVGLAGILSAVEAQGYEVRVLSIPACAVGSPHRRERFWIMAHSCQQGRKRPIAEPGADGLCAEHSQSHMANTAQRGQRISRGTQGQPGHADQCHGGMGNTQPELDQRRSVPSGGPEGAFSGSDRPATPSPWSNFVWLPCADGKVRRAPDDSFSLVDGLHRSLLGALGNSIVPQIAAEIIQAMIESETVMQP